MTRGARGETLADLDARALPVVAKALRRVGHASRTVAGPDGIVGRRVVPWVRSEPVIAVARLAVDFAAFLIAATGGDDQSAVRPPSHLGPRLASGQALGPTTGESVSAYESQATHRRDALNQLASSQRLSAVVDLSDYLSLRAVGELLAKTPGLVVQRGFARVPPPQNADVHVLLTSAQADLSSGLAAAAQHASQIALHYERELSRSITHPSTTLTAQIAAGAAQAAQARLDATGLGPSCACMFALVVTGPVGQLQELAGQAAVRVLDPAPVGASLRTLMVVPLQPQITDVVPPISFAGD
ncbi:MAG: hypothetical protein ACTHK4_02260 [Mycobacteriales bacterium]